MCDKESLAGDNDPSSVTPTTLPCRIPPQRMVERADVAPSAFITLTMEQLHVMLVAVIDATLGHRKKNMPAPPNMARRIVRPCQAINMKESQTLAYLGKTKTQTDIRERIEELHNGIRKIKKNVVGKALALRKVIPFCEEVMTDELSLNFRPFSYEIR